MTHDSAGYNLVIHSPRSGNVTLNATSAAGRRRNYAGRTYLASNRLLRLAHSRRLSIALALVQPAIRQHILDIGAGDLRFMAMCRQASSAVSLSAVEPLPFRGAQVENLTEWRTVHDVPAGLKFDAISCLETMEHLQKRQLTDVLRFAAMRLAPHGKMIISVPVEIGLPALLKNVLRAMLNPSHRVTLSALWWTLVGQSHRIRRPTVGNPGHIGFDHRLLRRRVEAEGFTIEKVVHSPNRWLPWWLNSQVLWIARTK